LTILKKCQNSLLNPARVGKDLEMNLREPMKFLDIIEMVKNKQERKTSYCVYCPDDIDDPTLDTVCYIDSYPEITNNDEEVYSGFVYSNNLQLLCREELIQDVIDTAISQKPNVSDSELLMAFIFYNGNDVFLIFRELISYIGQISLRRYD